MLTSCEDLILGAGITGLTITRELVSRGASGVTIIEKEPELGRHASGRNSGILHAGIYYSSDTLKARFCVEGNHLMKAYCEERGLPLRDTGKVIVASTMAQTPVIDELKLRADACGARAEVIDEERLKELEPGARTVDSALHAPDTATVDPLKVLRTLENDLVSTGKVKILKRTSFERAIGPRMFATSRGAIRARRLINCAGAFADRVAHSFGVTNDYRLVPFKGTYYEIARSDLVRGNVYPVPDLGNPFLGIHLSTTTGGRVYAGPTAIPALSPENYRPMERLTGQTLSILWRDIVLFLCNLQFRYVARRESAKYWKRWLFQETQRLVLALTRHDLFKTAKVGIRPQLVHWHTRTFTMDFLLHRHDECLHVLNAVSPAFTSSMAFARYAVDVLMRGGERAGGIQIHAARDG